MTEEQGMQSKIREEAFRAGEKKEAGEYEGRERVANTLGRIAGILARRREGVTKVERGMKVLSFNAQVQMGWAARGVHEPSAGGAWDLSGAYKTLQEIIPNLTPEEGEFTGDELREALDYLKKEANL